MAKATFNAVAIFNYCDIEEKPVLQRLMSMEDFMKRDPIAAGSRAGRAQFGLVEMKGEGVMGAFRRIRVYIGLNKENIGMLRQHGLKF